MESDVWFYDFLRVLRALRGDIINNVASSRTL